jgi:hypothetical protein
MFDEDTHHDLLIEPKDNESVLCHQGLHLTITTLMASATRGCHLCSVLCGSFKLSGVELLLQDDKFRDAQLLGTIWRHCLQTARLAICFRRHDRTPLYLGQVDTPSCLANTPKQLLLFC